MYSIFPLDPLNITQETASTDATTTSEMGHSILQEKLTKLWNMHKSNVLREEINQTVYQTVLIMK